MKLTLTAVAAILSVFLMSSPAHAATINKSASTTASGLTNTDLNSGLVGYWPFDGKYMTWASGTTTVGTSTDASGNGNNGTLVGMSRGINVVAGKIGQALRFNAVNSYINLGTNSGVPVYSTTTAYSVAFWIKDTNSSSASPKIYVESKSNTPGQFQIAESSSNVSKLSIFIQNTAGGTVLNAQSTNTVFNNVWNYVVWIDNVGAAKLYINGVQDATNFAYTPAKTILNQAAIGANTSQGSVAQFFNGSLDDFRLYNRALSATEVKQLYDHGLTTIDNTNVNLTNTDLGPGSASGLTAYYPLSGPYVTWSSATAGTLTDASGNGNTGTLENMNRATSAVAGRAGQALAFDGASAYVQGNTSLIAAGSTTVCAWIKQSSFVGTANAIVANTKFIFFTSSTNNTLGLTSDGSTNAVSANNAVSNNVWQFVCGTRNASGTTNLYVNASSTGTANQSSGAPAVSTFNTDVGVKGNAIADFFAGSISDVRIYGRVLSATEITQLYNETKGDIVNKSDTGLTNTDLTSASSTSRGNPSGLVGYWPFDGKYMTWSSATVGTSTDASGNGNNGTLVGMNRGTSVVAGKIGQALSFVGTTSQYVKIPYSSSLEPSKITIAGWFKATQTPAIIGAIITGEYNGVIPWNISLATLLDAGVCTSTNCFLDFTSYNGYSYGVQSATNFSASSGNMKKWFHFAAVYDGTNYIIYVNGVKNATATGTAMQTNTGYFTIGAESLNGTFYYPFIGFLDDVRVYNRALSATEVQQLYNMGR